jgi:hypothetical protein
MTSTPSPNSQNVRLTISVTPEVHETFQRLAKAGSMSISRAMGDWLGDTIEAADYMAGLMEKARAAPKVVMQEMHAYALGLADETGALMDKVREDSRKARSAGDGSAKAGPASGRRASPPSGNTGGKGTSIKPVRAPKNKLLDLLSENEMGHASPVQPNKLAQLIEPSGQLFPLPENQLARLASRAQKRSK